MRTTFVILLTLAMVLGLSGVTAAEPVPKLADGDVCNGVYDEDCTCPSGNFTCNQNQPCEKWVAGYCIVGE